MIAILTPITARTTPISITITVTPITKTLITIPTPAGTTRKSYQPATSMY